MLADYFTKPLQGNVFRKFRSVILGYTHINELLLDPDFLLKECVEKRTNIVIKKYETKNNNHHVMYAETVKNGKEKTNGTHLVNCKNQLSDEKFERHVNSNTTKQK
jgi:hypothetical protein